MKTLRALLWLAVLAAGLFFALRLGHLLGRPVLTLDRTQVVLEKVRRIQKVNLSSAFASRITPDERSNLLVDDVHFYFKYVALIRVDVYVDYSHAAYDPQRRVLRLPALEFEAHVVPGASFLWKCEGDLENRPTLQRRFTQSEEEIMRSESVSEAHGRGSSLRMRAMDSCRQFFARFDADLALEFADEK